MGAYIEVCRSLEEKAWNINIEASDMVYTDALEYYSQVQDAARRRVDSAESIYNELHGFFRNMGSHETDQPTQKKAKKDFNAVLKGKKDGKVMVKNIKPKTTAVDVTFREDANHTLDRAAAYNLNIVKKMAINTLRLLDVGIARISMKNKRFMLCMNFGRYLDTLMAL